MIFDKKGLKGNNFVHLFFAFLFVASLVYVGSFAMAQTVIGLLNITNGAGVQFNASSNLTSISVNNTGEGVLLNINEDTNYVFNFSIDHIAAARNLTAINITLPSTFAYWNGSSRVGNASTGIISFNVTQSAAGNFNGSVLTWNATNLTSWIINRTGFNNYTYIAFNATAWEPGYYNMSVRFFYNATFSAANLVPGGYNETNFSIRVNDRTKPYEINLSTIPKTYPNISGSFTINLSVLDNGNLTAGLREYDVTGVNITIINSTNGMIASYLATNVSDKYWNITIPTTSFSDGLYNFSIFANDSDNNINVTNISNVRIDNTAPTGSVSCTPGTVNLGDTVTCTCSPSDGGSGENSSATSITANPSTTNTGTYTVSCSFADLAGKTGTASGTYVVEQGGNVAGTGTGGSGSAATAGTTAKVQSFTKITPGAASIVKNFDAETGLKEIQIDVKNEAQNVKVSVTKYSGKPAEVSVEKAGKVFQYMQIKVDNVADKLNKATISTKVKKTWVSDNGLTKDKVSLFKFDETAGKWNELTTTFASEDTTYYYYDAEVTSFSYFAIGERGVVEVTTPGTGTTPGGEDTSGTTTAGGTNLTWLWVLIGVVVLAAIAWFVWGRKK
ncbi:PGF-pre-PGF domain-containing protein [Candidatus Pacearchaeota archaeon]|nr:PGF-pre-PGF domain-containing protein [Candidatus Pacearchaeota archaeon]